MKRSLTTMLTIALCTAGMSATAFAEKFHYYSSDGGCHTMDTSDLSGGPYNHNNFFPGGGWGACIRVRNGQLAGKLASVKNPQTGDVIGSVREVEAAGRVAGDRIAPSSTKQ